MNPNRLGTRLARSLASLAVLGPIALVGSSTTTATAAESASTATLPALAVGTPISAKLVSGQTGPEVFSGARGMLWSQASNMPTSVVTPTDLVTVNAGYLGSTGAQPNPYVYRNLTDVGVYWKPANPDDLHLPYVQGAEFVAVQHDLDLYGGEPVGIIGYPVGGPPSSQPVEIVFQRTVSGTPQTFAALVDARQLYGPPAN